MLVDDATKTARNAALRSELAPLVEAHMQESGRCAQFNSVLVRSAKSCNSLSIDRCSRMSYSSQIFNSSCTYRIDSAILDYRPASGNVQVLHNILFYCVCPIQFFFLQMTSLAANLLLGNMPVRHRLPSFRASKCNFVVDFCAVLFLIHWHFLVFCLRIY